MECFSYSVEDHLEPVYDFHQTSWALLCLESGILPRNELHEIKKWHSNMLECGAHEIYTYLYVIVHILQSEHSLIA